MLVGASLSICILTCLRRPLLILLGLALQVVGLALCGPSQVLALPDSLLISSIGFAILGLGHAFSMMPALPELIHYLSAARIASRNKASDLISSLGDCTGGFSDLFAPVIGAYLSSQIGFRLTTDLVLFIAFTALLVYATMAGVFSKKISAIHPAKEIEIKESASSISPGDIVRPKADSMAISKKRLSTRPRGK